MTEPNQIDQWRAEFARDGYLALTSYFTAEQIDHVQSATNELLQSRAMEIVVDSLGNKGRTLWGLAEQADPKAFKFNDLYLLLDQVREMALGPELGQLLRALLNKPPVLCNSLTFEKGSGQILHIDSLFMTPHTPGDLIATWVAFEDVDPLAGPLEYYPGSHLIPLYHFRDGTRHANTEEFPEWLAYIKKGMAERHIEKKTFIARKGDLFIWHSDLVHGGSEIRDQSRGRKSLVCHYSTESDCRRIPDWNLIPINAGFWLDRLPLPVNPDPNRFDENHPFPEERYLRRNPDLQTAMAAGQITSGYEHYRAYGFSEGRVI